MSDNNELSLPKATISKIIKETLPNDLRCANDTRDLVADCCVEFVRMLSADANEKCQDDNKKTISAEHVLQSLRSLGFEHYTKEVSEVYDTHKLGAMKQSKTSRKLSSSGMSEEELLLEQQKLFAKSRSVYEHNLQSPASSPMTTTSPQFQQHFPPASNTMPADPSSASASSSSPAFPGPTPPHLHTPMHPSSHPSPYPPPASSSSSSSSVSTTSPYSHSHSQPPSSSSSSSS